MSEVKSNKAWRLECEALQAQLADLNDALLAERLNNAGKVHPCDDSTAANLASALASEAELRTSLAKIDDIVELWRTGIYSAQEAILSIQSRQSRARYGETCGLTSNDQACTKSIDHTDEHGAGTSDEDELDPEEAKLVHFFCGEGWSRFGYDGDVCGLSPAETAIRAMRELLKQTPGNPAAAMDEPCEACERVLQWAEAYPLAVFPEPDFKRVAEVLKAAGLSLDQVSASNMRHVITRVAEIVRPKADATAAVQATTEVHCEMSRKERLAAGCTCWWDGDNREFKDWQVDPECLLHGTTWPSAPTSARVFIADNADGDDYEELPGTLKQEAKAHVVDSPNAGLCLRCGQTVTDGRGGCEGAQHGNQGCALNNPMVPAKDLAVIDRKCGAFLCNPCTYPDCGCHPNDAPAEQLRYSNIFEAICDTPEEAAAMKAEADQKLRDREKAKEGKK